MDLHLVWTKDQVFLKPIPRFLLEPAFWTTYVAYACDCPCPVNLKGVVQGCSQCPWKCALGFLVSYAALISHESDFIIAKEKHLIPPEVQWQGWRHLIEQLDPEHIGTKTHRRFQYGELRLSRLNMMYRFTQPPFFRGYVTQWSRSGTFFHDNFTALASVTVYLAIILTALQVGLATNALSDNEVFQSFSYGFTIFSILLPPAVITLTITVFCLLCVNAWIMTSRYNRQRMRHISRAD